MQNLANSVWEEEYTLQFAEVLVLIDDSTIMKNFLRDVMTEKEIIEISARLQAAKMLQEGIKYTEIIEKTRLSSRTIARISDWMQNGKGGYASALQLTSEHHSNM